MFRATLVVIFLVGISTVAWSQPELQLAHQYYAQEEYEKALTYLEELEKRYSNRKIYELKLNCYLAMEDYKAAEKHIEQSIRKSQNVHYGSFADLTYVYRKQEKSDKAEELLQEVKDELRQNPNLAYGYANAFQKRGYPGIAIELFETAEEKRSNSNYLYQKALLYGEVGDIKKMYAAYVDMVESQASYLNTVKQLLGRAMQGETDSENTQYLKETLIKRIQDGGPETLNELLVFIFIKEKNFSGAFTQLKALDKRKSGNKTQLFKLGQVALNNEEYITARRIFNYIIDTGPNGSFYAEALLLGLRAEKQRLLAADATQVEQWHSLQKEYYKVLKQLKGLPEVSELTIDLADLTAFQLNEADTAAGMLKNLITTGYISKSDLARAKIQLGDILLYQGNRWDAIIYYGQAEKAFEQSPIGQEAKFKRAKAAYYVGDFEWAQGIFNALKASTSKMIANDALYYSLLINDNIALDTSTEAMELFARADLMNYQQKPDSALYILGLMEVAFIEHPIQDEVLFLKSEILIDKKRYEEAVQSLTTLLKDHQDDILADDAQYMLARLYEEKLGKVLEAQELYQNLFTEHPDSFYASEARKRYRALRGDVLN